MSWDYFRANIPDDRAVLRFVLQKCAFETKNKKVQIVDYSKVRSVVYLACRVTDKRSENSYTAGAVVLTSVRRNDEYNIGLKLISEASEPYYFDAPRRIIDRLSPTDNERAKRWRENCLLSVKRKAELRALPVGARVKLNDDSGTRLKLIDFFGKRKFLIEGSYSTIPLGFAKRIGYTIESEAIS